MEPPSNQHPISEEEAKRLISGDLGNMFTVIFLKAVVYLFFGGIMIKYQILKFCIMAH